MSVVAYLLITVGAFWTIVTLAALSSVFAVRKLPCRSTFAPSESSQPSITVIISARDEQQHIEHSLRSILAQKGIELEVVVVDDRSTDATGEILDRFASEDERLRVVHVSTLPGGWLGKCHACYQGARLATGEWLLFADADTTLKEPDVLLRSIWTLNRDEADHMALWPTVNTRGPLACGAVFAWQASISAYAPPILINHDIGKRALGIGAYNLVRASAYRQIGGHEPLRMEVVDDIKLAVLLRRAGFRQRVYKGIGQLQTSWGGSVREMIGVLEKNWFAAIGFNFLAAVGIVLLMSTAWVVAMTGPLWDTGYGWFALGGVLSIVLPSLFDARAYGWPLHTALFAPLGSVVFVIAAVHSVYKTVRQGGIRWRDTFYSLDELRRGNVK